jgi:hypothetical protein
MIIVLIRIVNAARQAPWPSGVAVPVVQVRVVRMLMREDAMAVFMRVGFGSVPRKIVLVPVMCVVDVRVRVSERFVAVLVHMAFGQVERDAGSHQ